MLAIAFGPQAVGWHTLANHDKRLPISLLAGVAWLAACWLIVRPRSWLVVVPSVIVAALFAAITLL